MATPSTAVPPGPDPLDRAPEPRPVRPPAGLLWAGALALVVIVIAGSVALRQPGAPDAIGVPSPSTPAGGSGTTPSTNPLLAQGRSLVGMPMPAFDLEALTLDPDAPAGRVRLADFAGKPLVVNLWAQYCVPCRTEMPAFEQVHQELGDRVAFLGIDVNDPVAEGRYLAKETGVTYALARDPRGQVLVDVGGTALPTTVVVDATGTVVRMRSGEWTAEELRAALDPVLGA